MTLIDCIILTVLNTVVRLVLLKLMAVTLATKTQSLT